MSTFSETPRILTAVMLVPLHSLHMCSVWNFIVLRYFNPVGAHNSGKIGEDPNGIPNNLTPYITQVAIGKRKELSVFGNDYPTKDGTGIRDYIHVVDLAKAHLAALRYLLLQFRLLSSFCRRLQTTTGFHVYNIGTGIGYSVLDVVEAFKRAIGKEIPYKIVDRRAGDVAVYLACPDKAKAELSWTATMNLDQMCQDAWNWQSKNPTGYGTNK